MYGKNRFSLFVSFKRNTAEREKIAKHFYSVSRVSAFGLSYAVCTSRTNVNGPGAEVLGAMNGTPYANEKKINQYTNNRVFGVNYINGVERSSFQRPQYRIALRIRRLEFVLTIFA